MARTKLPRLIGLMIGIAAVDVAVLSPGLLDVAIGSSAISTAIGITLLAASALALLYGSYVWLFQSSASVPVKLIEAQEDYGEALRRYRRIKPLEHEVKLALEQLERMKKKTLTLDHVLKSRFDPSELSYQKFASAIREVEKLFYFNIRSVINRLGVIDEKELEQALNPKGSSLSGVLQQEKAEVYKEYLLFVRESLAANEEILLKLDKLLLEISRLDGLEPEQIEFMPCMQEIDLLIRHTKYYKS